MFSQCEYDVPRPLSAHWARVWDKNDIRPGLPLFGSPSQFPEFIPKKLLAKCFPNIISAHSTLLFFFFFAMPDLPSSAYIFRILYFPAHSKDLLPGSSIDLVRDTPIPPSTTGFNQLSLVIIRKPLLHIPRDPGIVRDLKRETLCFTEWPSHPHTCVNGQQNQLTRKRRTVRTWIGTWYTIGNGALAQIKGKPADTKRRKSQSKSKT